MFGILRRPYKAYIASFSGLPKVVWLLSLVVLVNRSGTMVLFFMSLYVTEVLHFGVSETGKIISVYGFGSLVGSFLGGWLSDKVGTRNIQLFSLLLSGIGFIVLGTLTTFTQIIIAFFLLAVVAEAFRPANVSAVAEATPPEKRARGYALNRLAINLGITIGPALGGFLAALNYHYIFWVDGVTSLGAAALFFLLFFFGKHFKHYKPESGSDWGILPWKDWIFLATLGLILILAMLFFQIFNTWPLYLRQDYRLVEAQIGTLLALNGFMIILIEMPLIHRLEAVNPIKTIALGALLLFSGFALLPLSQSYGYAALLVIVWTVGEILVFPLMTTFIANRASDANRGKYVGMFIFTFSLALIIGPALGTWIYDSYGPDTLWGGAGMVGVLVCLGFLLVSRLLQRESAPKELGL